MFLVDLEEGRLIDDQEIKPKSVKLNLTKSGLRN